MKLVGGDQGTGASFIFKVGDKLYFEGEDDEHGSELHVVSSDGGGGGPVSPFNLRLKIHANAKGHTNVISEGESLTFEAVTTGPAVEKVYWDFGDGKLTYFGKSRKPTRDYADNFATPTVNVRVKVKPVGENKFYNVSVPLTVNNIKPQIKVTMPRAFVTWAPMPFFGSVIDPDVTSGKLKSIDIKWDDATTSTIAIDKSGVFSGVHIWTSSMLLGRSVRITANDGDATATKRQTVIVEQIVTFSASDAAASALKLAGTYIGGTKDNDRITIKQKFGNAEVLLLLLNSEAYDIMHAKDSRLHVYSGDGRDRVELSPDLNISAQIYGGADNDTLRGGAARDSLYGQGGSDSLDGRGGKDLEKQ